MADHAGGQTGRRYSRREQAAARHGNGQEDEQMIVEYIELEEIDLTSSVEWIGLSLVRIFNSAADNNWEP